MLQHLATPSYPPKITLEENDYDKEEAEEMLAGLENAVIGANKGPGAGISEKDNERQFYHLQVQVARVAGRLD